MKCEITRKILKILLDFRQPVHMLTKSPSVLRTSTSGPGSPKLPTPRSRSASRLSTRPFGRRWSPAPPSRSSASRPSAS
jgi:hypothetical protein